jgi:hypothetical protein
LERLWNRLRKKGDFFFAATFGHDTFRRRCQQFSTLQIPIAHKKATFSTFSCSFLSLNSWRVGSFLRRSFLFKKCSKIDWFWLKICINICAEK